MLVSASHRDQRRPYRICDRPRGAHCATQELSPVAEICRHGRRRERASMRGTRSAPNQHHEPSPTSLSSFLSAPHSAEGRDPRFQAPIIVSCFLATPPVGSQKTVPAVSQHLSSRRASLAGGVAVSRKAIAKWCSLWTDSQLLRPQLDASHVELQVMAKNQKDTADGKDYRTAGCGRAGSRRRLCDTGHALAISLESGSFWRPLNLSASHCLVPNSG